MSRSDYFVNGRASIHEVVGSQQDLRIRLPYGHYGDVQHHVCRYPVLIRFPTTNRYSVRSDITMRRIPRARRSSRSPARLYASRPAQGQSTFQAQVSSRQSAPLESRTHALGAQPCAPSINSLGKESQELHRPLTPSIRDHRTVSRKGSRIGSKLRT